MDGPDHDEAVVLLPDGASSNRALLGRGPERRSVDELVTWGRRLTDMVVPHGEIVDAHYGSALSFKDPDGLPLEVFRPPGA